jgi:transposase
MGEITIRQRQVFAQSFYDRVYGLLETEQFDTFAEKECVEFYAENNGRPSLMPWIYVRLLLVGYFEGIGSERGIA